MNPNADYSPVQLLSALGLGTYSAAAAALLAFLQLVLAHLIMPNVPQPSAETSGFLTFLWKLGNAATGGYGNAAPSATVAVPATTLQIAPAVPVPGPTA